MKSQLDCLVKLKNETKSIMDVVKRPG